MSAATSPTEPTAHPLLLVIDPAARREDGESVRIARDVLSAGAPVKVCLPQSGEELARALARPGTRRPVVVGDDRALLRAVELLYRERRLAECPLSVVPVGSAESVTVAGALGVPTDPVRAARTVLNGAERRLDLLVDDEGGVVLGPLRITAGVAAGCAGEAVSGSIEGGTGRCGGARPGDATGTASAGLGPGGGRAPDTGGAADTPRPDGAPDAGAGGDAPAAPPGWRSLLHRLARYLPTPGAPRGRPAPPSRPDAAFRPTVSRAGRFSGRYRPERALAAVPRPAGQPLRVVADGVVLADTDRPVERVSVSLRDGAAEVVVCRPRPAGSVRARARTFTVSGGDFRCTAARATDGPLRARTWTVLPAALRLTVAAGDQPG